MAYTKTTWVNDEPPDIDADNLNKMEQGIYDAQFPDGGTEGQLLAKTVSGQEWVDADGLPAGGTVGQVLTKNSSTDGDASWQTPTGGGTWGSITGTLSDQTDLQNALDAKSNIGNIATIETSPATATHAVGDFILWNGQLYSVISSIAVGETLTVGTNITATSAGSELTSLKNGLNDSGTGYIKLPDGTLICYGETGQIFPTNLTGKTSGTLYYHEYSPAIVFPVQFNSGLKVIVSRTGGREAAVSWVQYTNTGITGIDTIGGVQTLTSNNPIIFSYIAIGRWK